MTLVIIVGPPALRLAEKRPQRDIASSRAFLLSADQTYQMNSQRTFFYPDRHLKIDSTALSAETVAKQIVAHFSLA